MFENIGWAELLVVVVAGLFIIGPERLPEAAAWLARTLRKVRDFASGARQQLKDEMGSDFDELRKPLEDLRSLRSMSPRKAITTHLLDGYDPTDDLRQYDVRSDFEEAKLPDGGPFRQSMGSTLNGSNGSANGSHGVNGESNGYSADKPVGRPVEPPQSSPAAPGSAQPAPFDPDAT